MLSAVFVARMGEELLPRIVTFGELAVGKVFPGGQAKDLMVHLGDRMTGFGMAFEGWLKAAQEAGGWCRRASRRGQCIHAVIARRGELHSCRVTRQGRGSDTHCRHLHAAGGRVEGEGERIRGGCPRDWSLGQAISLLTFADLLPWP